MEEGDAESVSRVRWIKSMKIARENDSRVNVTPLREVCEKCDGYSNYLPEKRWFCQGTTDNFTIVYIQKATGLVPVDE